MSEQTLNFQNLPKDANKEIPEGIYKIGIKLCKVEVTEASKTRAIIEPFLAAYPKVMISRDYVNLFDEHDEPDTFGQYKLRAYLEATGIHPEGDFKPKLLQNLLPGKYFMAQISYREYNNKRYLQLGHPSTFQPAMVEAPKEENPGDIFTPDSEESAKKEAQEYISNDDEL